MDRVVGSRLHGPHRTELVSARYAWLLGRASHRYGLGSSSESLEASYAGCASGQAEIRFTNHCDLRQTHPATVPEQFASVAMR